jgi:hypothetical protein
VPPLHLYGAVQVREPVGVEVVRRPVGPERSEQRLLVVPVRWEGAPDGGDAGMWRWGHVAVEEGRGAGFP